MCVNRSFRQRAAVIMSLIVLGIAFPACAPEISEEERNEVYSLIEWNLYYARIEDLNGYMWTLHPDAPGLDETQAQMAMLFQDFDLAYNIEEWEIQSINSQSARVRVVQTTVKIAGPDPFRDNRLEAVHTLRKDSTGAWKIFSTELREDSIEYLQ